LELIFLCFGLRVGEGSVEIGIGVTHRTVLLNILLARKCSTGAKTQFVTLYRPLPMTYSQPLSLHDRGDHLCRDGGVKGRYLESVDRGAGQTRAPIFGAYSSARLAAFRLQLERTNLMTRCVSQVWQGSAYTVAVLPCCCTVTRSSGFFRKSKMSCRTQQSIPAACSIHPTW